MGHGALVASASAAIPDAHGNSGIVVAGTLLSWHLFRSYRAGEVPAYRAVVFAGYYYALPDGFIWHTQSPETVVVRLQYGLAIIVRVPCPYFA